jgi:predicted anti-sigma-YlaC factor YlaD
MVGSLSLAGASENGFQSQGEADVQKLMIREENQRLRWQSKLILLLVVPWTAISVVLQGYWWLGRSPIVAVVTLGISAVFGLIVWRMRAGTLAAAATGTVAFRVHLLQQPLPDLLVLAVGLLQVFENASIKSVVSWFQVVPGWILLR